MFRRSKRIAYDPEKMEPVVRKSICTGEMTLGFVETGTGKFHDVRLASGQADIDAFMKETGVDSIRTIY
ncbi:MAG: aspartate dehydrogenase [Clostridiales bacterium]|nr:aspartate dehydrogenase [Clostridiales bacterium]